MKRRDFLTALPSALAIQVSRSSFGADNAAPVVETGSTHLNYNGYICFKCSKLF